MMEFSATIQTHNKNIMEPPLLPPGFRFHPLDHELLEHYLARKIVDANFTVVYIGDVDLNRCEPWDLPEMAKMGEKEWYFFALRDRKYPTGKRTNRATEAGYWKATGKDKEVMSSRSLSLLGMKKTLVFYKGRAPRGEKTNWIMHEYRSLESDHCHASNSPKDSEWVICRIYKKTPGGKKVHIKDMETSNIYNESEALNTLPPLESSHPTAGKDPGFDSDGSQQDDHVTKFARQDYQNALYSNGFRSNQSDFWEPSLQSGSFAPNESVSDHLNMPNMRPYSYEDFYISNQQFYEGCLAVNNTGKMKQGTSSVLAPPFFSHAFDPSPSKGSDHIFKAAIDYHMISRQCKAEPHDNVRVSEDPIRSSHSINMDNNLLSDNIVCLDIAHAKDLSVAEINAPYNLLQSTTSSWWI